MSGSSPPPVLHRVLTQAIQAPDEVACDPTTYTFACGDRPRHAFIPYPIMGQVADRSVDLVGFALCDRNIMA